jgi:beta-galactosidase
MPVLTSLDRGWRFHRGDIRVTNPGDWKFERAHWMKTGKMAPATPGYDDAAWRTVDLPHDWAVEGVPDPADVAVQAAEAPLPGVLEWPAVIDEGVHPWVG